MPSTPEVGVRVVRATHGPRTIEAEPAFEVIGEYVGWRPGAKVLGYVPSFAVVAGVPARFLRWREGHEGGNGKPAE